MIDNTLLYNGYNSYEMTANEHLWGNPAEVELYSEITLQAVVIRLDGKAQGRFELRWLGADGKKIGDDTLISFDVGSRWSRKTATVSVPEAAVKVAPCIYNTSADKWHISCPMLEAGEIASAFDASLADRVSWHDATGSYVGFLRADQIVAGVLRAVSGDSGFDLEAPRIWMTSKDGNVTWEASPDNPIMVKQGGTPVFYVEGDNLKMTGEINAGRGTIGGYEITPTGLRKSLFKVFGPFTEADQDYVYDRIMGTYTTTQADLDKYDFYNYGHFNSHHTIEIRRMLLGLTPNPKTVEYVVELNTANPSELIKLYSPTYPDRLPVTLGNTTVRAFKLAQHGAPSGTFSTLNGQDLTITVEDGIITSIFESTFD